MRFSKLVCFVCFLSCLFAASSVFAAAGDLDISFSADGHYTYDVSGSNYRDHIYGGVFDSEGRLIVVGTSYQSSQDMLIIRFTAAGILDTEFDSDGIATFDFHGGEDYAYDIVIDGDGNYVVIGYATDTNKDFAAIRVTESGALDTTFNASSTVASGSALPSAGMVRLSPDSTCVNEWARGVVLDSAGKIVITGYCQNSSASNRHQFAFARLNSDGTTDTQTVYDYSSASHDRTYDISIAEDGNYVLAASVYNGSDFDAAIAKFTTNFALDTTFNSGGAVPGIQSFDVNSGADSLFSAKFDSDGKIVFTGYGENGSSDDDVIVGRLNSDGTFDTTFNTTGVNTIDFPAGGEDWGIGLAFDSQNKIIVAGKSYSATKGQSNIGLLRITTDGTVDTTFGSSGYVSPDLGPDIDYASNLVIGSDDNIWTIGTSFATTGSSCGTSPTDPCYADVSLAKFSNQECGNGAIEYSEECDDGNTTDDDGCSATCEEEEAVQSASDDATDESDEDGADAADDDSVEDSDDDSDAVTGSDNAEGESDADSDGAATSTTTSLGSSDCQLVATNTIHANNTLPFSFGLALALLLAVRLSWSDEQA